MEVSRNGKHGMQMILGAIDIFLLFFAHVILMSSTPAGLQNQLNHLRNEVLTLIKQILCFFVWADICLREKDVCPVMKRSRLQMHINIWK